MPRDKFANKESSVNSTQKAGLIWVKDSRVIFANGVEFGGNISGSGSQYRTVRLGGSSVNFSVDGHYHHGLSKSMDIKVDGNANTYYPVVLPAPGDKSVPQYITVWKNLGSTSASYSGNHSDGGCSCWYQFEGRVNYWDGNGGYYKTLRAWYGYAPVVSHVDLPGGPVGNMVIWLRGGGTVYTVSCNFDFSSVPIYYSSTNLGSSTYPRNVAPRTDIGNGGILRYTYIANIDGNAVTANTASTCTGNSATATTLQTSRTIWGQSFNGSGNVDGKLTINDNITGGGTTNSLLNILYNGTHEYGVVMKLHSYGNDSPGIRFSHSSSSSELNSQVNTNWTVGMYNNSMTEFAITQDRGTSGWGTARFYINNSGNVGIGNTGPSYKLHVSGDIYSTGYIRAASGFVKGSSSDSYVLLGGGGHKAESNLSVLTSSYPYGFTSRGTSDWSGVAGTFATDWSVNGADIMFKYNGSRLNVITDGQFFQGIDVYGSSKRVLDEYDLTHTTWTTASVCQNATTFTVGGDANTYYPVCITNPASRYPYQFVSITRHYSNDAAPNTWNTNTHKGGLSLTILWNGSSYWDGNGSGGQKWPVMLYESYCRMVGGFDNYVGGMIVWLRGGNATYWLYGTHGTPSAIVHLSTYTDNASRSFAPRSASQIPTSISCTWPISISGNADTVDGYHASSFALASDLGNMKSVLDKINGTSV